MELGCWIVEKKENQTLLSSYKCPLIQIQVVYLAGCIDMLIRSHDHRFGGDDVGNRRHCWELTRHPDSNGNIVCVALEHDGNSARYLYDLQRLPGLLVC